MHISGPHEKVVVTARAPRHVPLQPPTHPLKWDLNENFEGMFVLIPEEKLAAQRICGADALVRGEAQHDQGCVPAPASGFSRVALLPSWAAGNREGTCCAQTSFF